MKKYLLLMLLAFVVAGGYAQKGRQAVGVQTGIMGFVDYEAGGGAELLYQYSFADAWRVETALGGYGGEDVFMVGNTSELQFLIGKRRIRPMIFAGFNLGYGEFHDYYNYTEDYCESGFIFGGFGGIGFDCRLSYSWSLMGKFFVGGATTIEDAYFGGKVGVTYNF